MANILSGNPWILDTVGTLTSERVRLTGVRWVGATTATHTAVLTDGTGQVIWASEGAGSSYVEADSFSPTRLYCGLRLTALGSGKVYVEFG